ncbi:MAG: hypothetical protein V1799_06490 [bacterium]
MGYIFEKEIELIINTIRARTIGEEETIRLKDVLHAAIHPAIKAYFKSEVELLLQQERVKEVRSPKFPYGYPDISTLQHQIDLILVNNYEFDRQEFELNLDHAVHFQFNYLCRPQWTLVNFVFENQRRRSTAEIMRRVKYCTEYIYYTEIIKGYVEDRGLAEMTYEEFSALLEKIDLEVTATHSSIELALMTKPLLIFILAGTTPIGQRPIEPKIPSTATIVFFEDKKLNDIKERLEYEREHKGLHDFSLQQLADIIEKVRTGNEEAHVEFPAFGEPKESERASVSAEESVEAGATDGDPKPVEDAAPLQKPPVKVLSDFVEDLTPPAELVGTPFPEADTPIDSSLVSLEAVSIHSLFSPSDQKAYVKKLFSRDEVAFRNALDALNLMKTWKEGAAYIEQIFASNNVDPFSEEAILFTDTAQTFFLTSRGG